MQIGKIINLKGYNKIFIFLKENCVLLILLIFFILGLCVGIFSFKGFEEFAAYSQKSYEEYINLRVEQDFFGIVFKSFFDSFTYICLTFILGCCVFGVAIIPFSAFLSGLEYGGLLALLYSEYTLKGIAFNTVAVLPSAVIFLTGLILSARESIWFSLKFIRLTFPKTQPLNLSADFKYYFGRYLKFTVIIIVSALLDGFISCNFLENLLI